MIFPKDTRVIVVGTSRHAGRRGIVKAHTHTGDNADLVPEQRDLHLVHFDDKPKHEMLPREVDDKGTMEVPDGVGVYQWFPPAELRALP